MSSRRLAAAFAVAAALLAPQARACFVHAPQPVQVWLDHVRIDIVNGVATKSYECAFKNPNGGAIVGGECYMELEPGAQIDGLSVTVDGKEERATILGVEEANKVFTEIVTKGGSAALLEYYGNQLIRTKLPRVPAGKAVTVKLRYTMPLKKAGDLYRISCLNTNPKSLAQTLKAASVTVRVKSDEPVKTIYSPSHKIAFFEEEGWDVGVKWSAEDYTPVSSFVLYLQAAPGEMAASVIAHRPRGEDGTFLMLLSPTQGVKAADLSAKDVLPKDVVFCVDASGSMLADGKMEQAKGALRHCVSTLRPQDRFNVVAFGTATMSFREGRLVEASEENRKAALEFVDGLAARGGTAISSAIERAFGHLGKGDRDGRMAMLLFATDGLPTIGERDSSKILAQAKALNTSNVRLFAFGEGYDVNAALLDALAREHQGETDYILPTEKIDERVAAFFDRVGSPVLTDLVVKIDGLKSEDVFPATLPDLFLGEQVMLVGRYRGYGKKSVTLTGKAGGVEKSYTYEVTFPEFTEDDAADFVPRLWAGRKVEDLLTRLRGQASSDKALVEEVTALATRYGIVTPYTAFLLNGGDSGSTPMPPGIAGGAAGAVRDLRGRFGIAPAFEFDEAAPAAQAVAGRIALDAAEPTAEHLRKEQVLGAKEVWETRRNSAMSGNATDFYRQAGLALNGYSEGLAATKRDTDALRAVRYVGDKTFYNRGGQWQESTFTPEAKARRQVAVGSAEYIELLNRDAKLAKYFALGNVVVSAGGEWVEVK